MRPKKVRQEENRADADCDSAMAEAVFTSCSTLGNAVRKCLSPSPELEWAYFPIIGRGEQVRLLCAEHGITLRCAGPAWTQHHICTRISCPF
jgi:hypothetical protein